VAIWVLSPISARKKVTSAVAKAPARGVLQSSSATLSGKSAHIATLRKEAARTQRIPLASEFVLISEYAGDFVGNQHAAPEDAAFV
jgi:hypothetical protein